MAIGGDLSITTRNGNDGIQLLGVRVGGRTNINTGGGEDQVSIRDGTEFVGLTTIDLGSGDDVIGVADTLGDSAAVLFGGRAAIRTGTGNDTARIGFAIAAGGDLNTLVGFNSPKNILDLGTGNNTFDPAAAAITSSVGVGVLQVLNAGLAPILLP